MRYYILTISLLLPTIIFGQLFTYSQIRTTAIDTLRKKDDAQFITYSYTIGVSADYFPNRTKFSIAQPIIFQRKEGSFIKETSFYFSTSDSVVRLIEYAWEVSTRSSNTEFNAIVKANKKLISDYFHVQPKETPETGTKSAKSIWENESVYVEQFIISGQRIRVLVSWK